MQMTMMYPPRPKRCESVIALHCSGAGPGQWRPLSEALGDQTDVLAPEHYGTAGSESWTGEHAFTLADEAARTIALIDESEDEVHLVGHSYGGGVALHAALARPRRIATMTLYEPSAFHLLPQMGEVGLDAFAEIEALAHRLSNSVITGDYRGGIAAFIDYWNGPGAFDAMPAAVQDALMRWTPKGPLDFRALIDNTTPAGAYHALKFPVLILRGEHAPRPTRLIAQFLRELLPDSRLSIVAGAGHMGPLTHASEVARQMARHIDAAAGQDSHAPSLTSQSLVPLDA